jgi:hypothetical protein
MHAVIHHTHAQEEGTRYNAVGYHLEQGALYALLIDREDAHRHEAHMGDGGIGDELLDVFLHHGNQRRCR